jgi:hypothetical protein
LALDKDRWRFEHIPTSGVFIIGVSSIVSYFICISHHGNRIASIIKILYSKPFLLLYFSIILVLLSYLVNRDFYFVGFIFSFFSSLLIRPFSENTQNPVLQKKDKIVDRGVESYLSRLFFLSCFTLPTTTIILLNKEYINRYFGLDTTSFFPIIALLFAVELVVFAFSLKTYIITNRKKITDKPGDFIMHLFFYGTIGMGTWFVIVMIIMLNIIFSSNGDTNHVGILIIVSFFWSLSFSRFLDNFTHLDE